MCSYLMLEIKYFVSLKTEFFKEKPLFWTRIHFKGGVKFSKILRGDAHKGWGGGSDIIFGGVGGGRGKKG